MNTRLGQGPIPSSSVWMASTFLLKGSQLGSARAPQAHSSWAARTVLPHPGATQLGLQDSQACCYVTDLNQKLCEHQTCRARDALPALAQALPCLRQLPFRSPVKFCKSFRTMLKCHLFPVAFPGTLLNQSEQTASSFLFLAGFYWCPYQLILDLFFFSVHQPRVCAFPEGWVHVSFTFGACPSPRVR